MDVPSSTPQHHTLTSSASGTLHKIISNSVEQASRSVSSCSLEEYASAGGQEGHVAPEQLQQPNLGNPAGLTTHQRPPQTRLRKKPKSLSIASHPIPLHQHAHMRKLSGISKTLSFPTFHSQPSDSNPDPPRPSSSYSANPPSTPTLRATSSWSINRSPSQKRRPPASHSSYGVETTLGPPPSYSTQRTLSEDRVWSLNRGSSSRTVVTTTTERVTPQLNEGNKPQHQPTPQNASTKEDLTALPLPHTSDPDFSSPETIDTVATPPTDSDMTPPTSAGGTNIPEETEAASKGLGLDGTHDDAKASSSDETQKSEDLFLNIAKTDASRTSQPTSKPDKRRSRISLPFFSNPRTQTAVKSSPLGPTLESEEVAPRSEQPRRFGKRSSLGQQVPGALTTSQYFDDARSHVSRAVDERSHMGSVTGRSEIRSRRHSNANNDSLRPPSRSHTSRTNRLVSENLYADRYKPVEQPPTESTISTTAPSTVWDELDDMRSRIRKLELTGKLPQSSAAAMSTTERPRTATTQATTMSSSPKHKTPVSTLPSQIEGISSAVHPLLHEALSNAKNVVSSEVYQKLQATAQDALQLSAMMNHEGYSGPSSAMSPANERQIRRRTESMCRSLTELAIAMLSEPKGVNSPTQRPASRDAYAPPPSALRSRRLSNELSDRPPVTSRVQSRLESRRTSLQTAQTRSPSTFQAPTTFETPQPPSSVVSMSTSARVPRTSTVVRSRRTPSFMDGANDEDDASPRPVSRAQTDVNVPSSITPRSSARDRATFSRQYTKQHPLPTSYAASQLEPTAPSRTPLPSNISRRAVSHATPHSAPVQPTFHRQFSNDSASSPMTPSTQMPTNRPPFTISIERRNIESPTTALPATPDSRPSLGTRQSTSTRRSLGFASRISNVSSRLKAARAERLASTSASRSPPKEGQEGASVMDDQENRPGIPERGASMGSVEAGS